MLTPVNGIKKRFIYFSYPGYILLVQFFKPKDRQRERTKMVIFLSLLFSVSGLISCFFLLLAVLLKILYWMNEAEVTSDQAPNSVSCT